ncbi:uncharacterized protein [Typha angustifolia]|uniref:uncharacterized protein isoform X1 n=1 Tax=Typha angustifolia TaxID=59011 RepID=UPI003C304E55
MAKMEEGTRDLDQQDEEPLEERTLNLLKDSKIDQELSASKGKKGGGKKHKMKWMKKPMAMSETILEFFNEDLREAAIRYLSSYLVEKRVEDPDNYYRAGFLVFNSCGTMCILLQEITSFYMKMDAGNLDARCIKRLANVLTLFQSVAANEETRQKFVDSRAPNFLIPLILFDSRIEVFDIIRSVALSVIGILCQGREPRILQWAIENDMVEACQTIIEIGSELNKVIALHILEAILQDSIGISYICNPIRDILIKTLMETLDKLVNILAVEQVVSPRLLFHVVRCYAILCTHHRGYNIVKNSLPDAITSGDFKELTEEFPVIRALLHQLLLSVGKVEEDQVSCNQVHIHPDEGKKNKLALCAKSPPSHNMLAPIYTGHNQVILLPSSFECY